MDRDGASLEEYDASDSSFRILGPPQVVTAAGQDVAITPGRQHIVLGVLLLEANRVVSIDHLIDAIWDDDPPATARTQVQICVSRLRNRLVEAGFDAIRTKPPGYLMPVRPGELDAQVFSARTAEADAMARAGRVEEAAEALGQAVGLWRGPALSGIESHILRAKATELDERRLAAVESHVDLQLRLGRHHELIGELSTLSSEHPLRERLRGLLMLALYRAGRQAEALEAYRLGRELMIDQLGLEPGEELRKLEAAILSGDPSLQAVDTLPVPPPRNAAEPEVVIPLQLPTDIGDFTGRAELIGQVGRLLAETGDGYATRVVVLAGKPGVGKSALAVHVAHRLGEEHFPDGQLYCDLGGGRSEPMAAVDVLGRFLRALGVPGEALPEQIDERAEMYRQLLARKRILVLLDDAAGESQVLPLLPGSGDSVVVVTSRARLTGLAGARVYDVDVFDTDEAVGMLASVVGRARVAGEPAAAEALIRLVGRLPLALRIVAARLDARPHWTLAWMLERLSDERRRLDELAHGEMMVRASLALTYDGLEPMARRLLELLGMLDGLSFPNWVAAALLDADYVSREHSRAMPGGTGNVKCAANYGPSFAAQRIAQEAGCQQVVWLDSVERRWVEEMGGMNMFFVRGDEVMTPALTGTLLPGVTRDSLLALASRAGYRVTETRISVDEWRAGCASEEITEVFACGTAAVVTPVGRVVDETGTWQVGDGEMGPVTRGLRKTLVDLQHGRIPAPDGWLHRIR